MGLPLRWFAPWVKISSLAKEQSDDVVLPNCRGHAETARIQHSNVRNSPRAAVEHLADVVGERPGGIDEVVPLHLTVAGEHRRYTLVLEPDPGHVDTGQQRRAPTPRAGGIAQDHAAWIAQAIAPVKRAAQHVLG